MKINNKQQETAADQSIYLQCLGGNINIVDRFFQATHVVTFVVRAVLHVS